MSTPAEIDGGSYADAAARVALALTLPTTWLHRRRDAVRFITSTLVSTNTEVEFSSPPQLNDSPRDVTEVPVAYLAKAGTRLVAVRDERGGRLPSLTSGESRRVAAGMLLALAEAEHLDEHQRKALERVALASPEEATAELRELRTAGMECSDSLIRAAELFALTTPLLLLLPPGFPSRRLVTIETETSLQTAPPALADRFAMSLGWRNTIVDWRSADATLSNAYELQVEADGLEVVEVKSDQAGARTVVEFGVSRTYPAAVFAAAAVIAAVLALGAARLSEFASAPEAASAILLAIPTVFAGLLAQGRTVGLAADFLLGSRLVLVASAICAYSAALALVLFPVLPHGCLDPALRLSWTVLTTFAVALAGVQLIGLIGPWVQARARARRRQPAAGMHKGRET